MSSFDDFGQMTNLLIEMKWIEDLRNSEIVRKNKKLNAQIT